MKERPILFNGPMIRAILDGSKTQTRRLVKPQPYIDAMNNFVWNDWNFGQSASGVPHVQALASPVPWSSTKRVLCPFGAAGDRLWVRETWRGVVEISAPGALLELGVARYVPDQQYCRRVEYKATQPHDGEPYRPSIHMPRWASRLTLEITGVRVERLNAISEADAAAEGIESLRGEGEYWKDYQRSTASVDELVCTSARDSFRTLWDSVTTPGTDWAANPWVWVIEFRRVNGAA